jgi:hypothetical protein
MGKSEAPLCQAQDAIIDLIRPGTAATFYPMRDAMYLLRDD